MLPIMGTAVDLTTGTAPWYYVAGLGGVLAIVGGVVGGLISLLSVKLSDGRAAQRERTRQQREDDQRWDLMIRELAARFLDSTDTLMETSKKALNIMRVDMTDRNLPSWRFIILRIDALMKNFLESLKHQTASMKLTGLREILDDAERVNGQTFAELQLIAPKALVVKAESLAVAGRARIWSPKPATDPTPAAQPAQGVSFSTSQNAGYCQADCTN